MDSLTSMNSVLGIRSSATHRHQWTSEAPYDPPQFVPEATIHWTLVGQTGGEGEVGAPTRCSLVHQTATTRRKKSMVAPQLLYIFALPPHLGGNLGSPASAFFLLSAAKRPSIQGYAKKSFHGVGRGMRFLFPPPPDQKCGTLFVSWRQKRLSALIRSGGR